MAPILGIWASSKSTVAADTGAYFPLQVITLGTATSTVTFSNIPSTYTHLQLRCSGHLSGSSNVGDVIYLRFNSDSNSNYSWHLLQGNGSSATASSGASQTYIYAGVFVDNTNYALSFSPAIIDILDYANTNKYKTTRSLYGYDINDVNYSRAALGSGNWRSNNAITSLTLTSGLGLNFTQYSSFALYGIKGA